MPDNFAFIFWLNAFKYYSTQPNYLKMLLFAKITAITVIIIEKNKNVYTVMFTLQMLHNLTATVECKKRSTCNGTTAHSQDILRLIFKSIRQP